MKALVVREILRCILTTSYSNRHIARLERVAANTVRRYRIKAKEKGLDWQAINILSDDALYAALNSTRTNAEDKRQPDWAYIHKLMQAKHQTLIQLWEEYRRIDTNDAYSYSQFTHYYRQYIGQIDISMRQIHYAGECVYVDYAGKTIPWIDSQTGEEHKAQIFVATMGCSQYTFAWASRSQKIEDWIDAHNRMFIFFNGVPAAVVPDNLKSAVTSAGKFPRLNRIYVELARHYDSVINP